MYTTLYVVYYIENLHASFPNDADAPFLPRTHIGKASKPPRIHLAKAFKKASKLQVLPKIRKTEPVSTLRFGSARFP